MEMNKGAEGRSRPGDTTAVVFWLTEKTNTLQRRPKRRKLPGRPRKSKLPVSSQFWMKLLNSIQLEQTCSTTTTEHDLRVWFPEWKLGFDKLTGLSFFWLSRSIHSIWDPAHTRPSQLIEAEDNRPWRPRATSKRCSTRLREVDETKNLERRASDARENETRREEYIEHIPLLYIW
jgi:hypothetical protein